VNKPLAAVAAVLSVVAILLAGAGERFRRVNADGPTLRMFMAGDKGPTVVFESGAGGPLETWVRVQPQVSKFARTISYDRAGNGLSEKGPVPRDGARIAAELHAALVNSHARPPYILVGHSLGGPYSRIFAGTYPREVAGIILVDPTQEDLVAWAKARDPKPERTPRLYDEVDGAPATLAQARESTIPSGIPVVLISGMGPREIPGFLPAKLKKEVEDDQQTLYPTKLKFHREWIEKIPMGKLVVTRESGHGIPFEEPALIVSAIHEVVENTHRRFALDAASAHKTSTRVRDDLPPRPYVGPIQTAPFKIN
jgi:pimeloyl-ACP methyl ester carboxylesterase